MKQLRDRFATDDPDALADIGAVEGRLDGLHDRQVQILKRQEQLEAIILRSLK